MKENRYIEILHWAYEKRSEGFSEEELFQKFDPKGTEEFKKWYLHVFRGNRNNEDCLIGLYDYKDNTHYCCLTAKGITAAIDFLGLEEARKAGREAKFIGILALIVAFLAPFIISNAVGIRAINEADSFNLGIACAVKITYEKEDHLSLRYDTFTYKNNSWIFSTQNESARNNTRDNVVIMEGSNFLMDLILESPEKRSELIPKILANADQIIQNLNMMNNKQTIIEQCNSVGEPKSNGSF